MSYELAGAPVPARLSDSIQSLLRGVASTPAPQKLVVDRNGPLFAAACHFQSLGLAEVVRIDDSFVTVALSPTGQARLAASTYLEGGTPALTARPGLALADLTTFELLSMLLASGWSLQAPPPRTRKDTLAYSHTAGGDKIVWVRSSQTALQHGYLHALAASHLHGSEVVPFMSD
eukprot:1519400-Alexandrium_andersonii.AAC.1